MANSHQVLRIQRLFKEGSWIIIGQIAAVIGSLFLVRVLTEYLRPDVYGELALGMTLATLANQVVFGPLGNGVLRFFSPARERGELHSYLQAVQQLLFKATKFMVLATITGVFTVFFLSHARWVGLASAAFAFSILNGFGSILAGIQNAARQRKIVAFHQGIDPFVRLLIVLGLIIWLGASSTVVMSGFVLAAGIVLFSQLHFFRKIAVQGQSGKVQSDWKADIWAFSWPISIFGMFTWVQLSTDRWALQLFASTQEVGLYAVLFQLGYFPMSMVSGLATQFLAPIFFQRAGDGRDNTRVQDVNALGWRITVMTLGITGLICLFACLFHAEIFKLFTAKEYASMSYLLPWMILSGGLFAAGQTLSLNLMNQLKTQLIMKVKIVTALLGIMLNMIGAYQFGIKGVVAAITIFSIIFLIGMMGLAGAKV